MGDMFYARLNDDGIVDCVMMSAGEIFSNDMIRIGFLDENLHGKKYVNGDWIDPKTTIEGKLEELSTASNAAIEAGFDFGEYHYAMTIEDQHNIFALSLDAAQGKRVPYHADDEICRLYNPEEFMQLAKMTKSHVTAKTTYFNLLKKLVERTETPEEITAITYGVELPADLAEVMAEVMAEVASNE